MNSWMVFCLYVAGGVFIQDQRSGEGNPQSKTDLEFILAAMKAIGNRHSITNYFTAQLEIDIESSGIRPHSGPQEQARRPNLPMNGLLPARNGVPMTVEDLHSLSVAPPTSHTNKGGDLEEICPYTASMATSSARSQSGTTITPVIGAEPSPQDASSRKASGNERFHEPPEGLRNTHPHPSLPCWYPPSNSTLNASQNPTRDFQQQQKQQTPLESRSFASSKPPLPAEPNVGNAGGSPFDIDAFLAGNTPSSDSSSSNTMQFPYRQVNNTNNNTSTGYGIFEANPNPLITSQDWPENPFNPDGGLGFSPEPSNAAQGFTGVDSWGQNPDVPKG